MHVLDSRAVQFSPARFVLGERLSVTNFARGLDITDPVFFDIEVARRRGHAGRPVHPAMYAFFQTVPGQELEDRLGFRWGHTLGAQMEFEAGVILGEEDEVVGQSFVDDAWESVGRSGATRQFLWLRSCFRRVDGEPACTWRVLFSERKEGAAGPAAASASTDRGTATTAQRQRPASEPPADLEAGSALPSHHVGAMGRLRFARIAVAIDNPDPLHIDDAVARACGLPEVIGPGSGTAGLLYEPVRRWAGMERILSGTVRLSAPLRIGTGVASSGVVASFQDIPGGRRAVCQTQLTTPDGSQIGTAEFTVLA
jgi:acyl dehydratase